MATGMLDWSQCPAVESVLTGSSITASSSTSTSAVFASKRRKNTRRTTNKENSFLCWRLCLQASGI